MYCIHCQRETADHPFHVLQVLTLHVRDLKGDKRVQALGDFEDYCVCGRCAEEHLERTLHNSKALEKALFPFAAVLVIGIALAVLTWRGEGALRLLGIAMTVGGAFGLTGTWQRMTGKRRTFAALGPEKAAEAAAWDLFLQDAPKKYGINDITYIPVNGDTLARKNGDLMILYELLPEIAVQAHKRIHGQEDA